MIVEKNFVVLINVSKSLPQRITFAPQLRKYIAQAYPIPEDAPVISILLFKNSNRKCVHSLNDPIFGLLMRDHNILTTNISNGTNGQRVLR